MARYRPDPYYSSGDLAYRDPPAQRWDSDRFTRERDYRGSPGGHDNRAPRRAPVYEEQRYYEEDRIGPRGQRFDRRYYEEEDYYADPRAARGAMVPFRPARQEAPPRPGIIRRQSSLDTFDRRPRRLYDDYDEAPPAERIMVPAPRAPSNRRYSRRQWEDYDDIKIQEPDYYGDDGFREFRERVWTSRRSRNNSRSRSRDRSEVVEEVKEEFKEEKTYPRKGKTRMPKRLVHTKVLFDLGYPFYEEDERTILVQKALGPDNIDQVLTMSKEYREREVVTTHLIEAPPAEFKEIREERIVEDIKTVPISEAPRSVREWDALSVRSPSPKSHRSRSRRPSHRDELKETIIEKKIIEREISPARSGRTGTTRRRGSSESSGTIIERTKIIRADEPEDSNSINIGPLALVVDRKPNRSERDIREEIRALEAERRALRRERRHERDSTELVKIEHVRPRSPSPRGEVIIERRGEDILEVKKDKRGRSRSAAPSPAILKAMMATLT